MMAHLMVSRTSGCLWRRNRSFRLVHRMMTGTMPPAGVGSFENSFPANHEGNVPEEERQENEQPEQRRAYHRNTLSKATIIGRVKLAPQISDVTTSEGRKISVGKMRVASSYVLVDPRGRTPTWWNVEIDTRNISFSSFKTVNLGDLVYLEGPVKLVHQQINGEWRASLGIKLVRNFGFLQILQRANETNAMQRGDPGKSDDMQEDGSSEDSLDDDAGKEVEKDESIVQESSEEKIQ